MEGAPRLLVPFVLVLAGCRGTADAPYPTYAAAPVPYVPNGASNNAFDAYVLAAGETEAAVASFSPPPLHRNSFPPRQRRLLLRVLAPALRRIASARGPCEFRYVPALPGDPLPGRAAWRLLGRALRWRIDDDLEGGSSQNAVGDAALAFRFANDLCGGGPADRTLGVEIANDAREAVVPALARLDPAGLHHLADAVKAGLLRRPALEKSLANGDGDAALALQSLQDAYQKGGYGRFRPLLGKEFRDVESVKELHGPKRAVFFAALDADRRRLAVAWQAAAGLPASRRAQALDVKLRGDRAQRAFARNFFLIGRPLLALEDRSVARLRLLVLEAELRRVAKSTGRAPKGLERVSRPWAIDPYNGRTFGYLPDGAEFRVYSVGENLKDDLGDTDPAGLEPDIRTVVP